MERDTKDLEKALPGEVRIERASAPLSIISCSDPIAFWGKFLGASRDVSSTLLLDPAWPEPWKNSIIAEVSNFREGEKPVILIPTSGSSGRPKLCIHDSSTLMEAARGYAERIGKKGIIHAVNVLPQHHVGGLMPAFRSSACDGSIFFADYRDYRAIKSTPFPLEDASISLVPTQLGRMLEDPELLALLKQFGLVLIGGAACPDNLLQKALTESIRLSPCYGSTETAAMVATLDPESFLAGHRGVGSPLPHARIEIGEDATILIHSKANFQGYHPSATTRPVDPFATGDLGFIDNEGNLHIQGRADRVIISGGENIHPELVETAIMATGLAGEVHCEGLPDPDWGQRVKVTVVPASGTPDKTSLVAALKGHLPSYALPKDIHFVDKLKHTAPAKRLDSDV